MRVAGEMYETLAPVLERYDVLICPSTAVSAVAADHDRPRASSMSTEFGSIPHSAG